MHTRLLLLPPRAYLVVVGHRAPPYHTDVALCLAHPPSNGLFPRRRQLKEAPRRRPHTVHGSTPGGARRHDDEMIVAELLAQLPCSRARAAFRLQRG